MGALYTIEGAEPRRRAKGGRPRRTRRASPMSLGQCERVPMGRRGGKREGCSIELCRTGRGRTGYEFTKGTMRCR